MSGVGGQGPGGVDLAAVARDDQLLDRLAARAGTQPDDQVAALLAAFAAEVDDGLAELLADTSDFAAPAADGAPGVRRGRGLRVTSLALVMGATLSVSGVAAAVTGDPLAPYKGVVSAMSGHDQLPEQAARVAHLNRALNGTRAAIAHGDLAGARAQLDALTAQLNAMTGLTKGERHALEARIAALEAALARAQAAPDHGPNAGVDQRMTRSAPGRTDSLHSDAGATGGGQSDGQARSDGPKATSSPGEHSKPADAQTKPSKEPRPATDPSADDQGATADDTQDADGGSATDSTATADTSTTDDTSDGSTNGSSDGSSGDPGGRSGGSERTSTNGRS